ncbi:MULTISPECIES: prolyl oligopeptidase family serine peptidase [unclassified Pseudoxanthomonas]|uniref:carboxylesterase family protein n=1 Tax=unclassified Pseudoxanthomonas TaxID=2645906 RepID=UPI003078775A
MSRFLNALRISSFLIATALLMPACTHVKESTGGRFVPRELALNGQTHRYQVFVPSRVVEGKTPVVLFLHGSGERGIDGEKQTQAGLGPYVRAHAKDFPAIVVFPQSPDGRSWDGDVAQMAFAALDVAINEFGGDPDRIYLTGMSRGGYGTFELAIMQPQRFAALAPVCGGITPPGTRPDLDDLEVSSVASHTDPFADAAQQLRAIPTWMFHGAKDDVVPPAQSRRLYAAMKAAGADVRYTEFPDASHNAWDSAYASTELWTWLFAQRRD